MVQCRNRTLSGGDLSRRLTKKSSFKMESNSGIEEFFLHSLDHPLNMLSQMSIGLCLSWRRLHSEGAGMKEFDTVALCGQGQLVCLYSYHESHVEDWPSQLQETSLHRRGLVAKVGPGHNESADCCSVDVKPVALLSLGTASGQVC